jgi:hypothetical protein
MCNRTAGKCSYSSTGALITPVSDACLKELYDFCCFDDNRHTMCPKLGVTYPFPNCSELNPVVTSVKFTDDANSLNVTFDKKITLTQNKNSCRQIFENFTATATCSVYENDHTILQIYFTAKVTDTNLQAGNNLVI